MVRNLEEPAKPGGTRGTWKNQRNQQNLEEPAKPGGTTGTWRNLEVFQLQLPNPGGWKVCEGQADAPASSGSFGLQTV